MLCQKKEKDDSPDGDDDDGMYLELEKADTRKDSGKKRGKYPSPILRDQERLKM
jgi:hypothetical protein